MTAKTSVRLRWPIAALADLIAVVIFAAFGRAAHGEPVTLAGVFTTAWPFVVGMAVAWLALLMWRTPKHWYRTAGLMAITIVVGNVLRVLVAGDSTHWTFIVVSVIVLSLLLFGWRLIVGFIKPRQAA